MGSDTETNAGARHTEAHHGHHKLYPPAVKPSRRAVPLLPFIARFIRNPLRSVPQDVYQQAIVTYGKKRILVAWVTAPELTERVLLKDAEQFPKTRLDRRVLEPVVGNGLLTAEGPEWRWQRKLASPLFRHSELIGYVPSMVAAAQAQLESWRKAGPAHTVDVSNDMTEMTFAVIADTVLAGIDVREGDALKRAGRAYLDPISWEVAAALLLMPPHWWHPGKSRMRRAAKEQRAVVQRMLDARRADAGPEGVVGDDLVARMLRATKPDGDTVMSDNEVIDNLATFLLAGHETTAKALTWTLYLLARAPDWQDRVRQEIDDVTGGAPLTADMVAKLDCTKRVLKESMRLYPPVPVMTRVNAQDVNLGGIDLVAPTLIVVPIYAIHRHEALWEDPALFDPDRFLPDAEAQHARTQFMPFGFGPRVCIGASFAMLEALTLLATLVRGARFEWDGRHLPEPISRVTLRPHGGMPLRVTTL